MRSAGSNGNFILADARGAAHRIGDRAGYRDRSNLTHRSGDVVCRDQRDVDLRRLVETQEVGSVEVRLRRAPTHNIDPAVQQIAQAEDRAALDLTVDGAGVDDHARIRDHRYALDGDLAGRRNAGLGNAGKPGQGINAEGDPLRGAGRQLTR